jgi:hypothetical protein
MLCYSLINIIMTNYQLRRLKWVVTLPLGDINTEAWSSSMGVGRGVQPYPVKKKIVEKPPKNSAGFCGGGQGLSWAVEPRKEEEFHVHNL